MGPFVGASRLGLVDGLALVFEGVRGSGGVCWVSLEAPSGWGKTRVGRELYARLAASQSSPRYWPAVIESEHRKAVVPTGEREVGSLPEFLWWGVSCSERSGVDAEALRADLGQLEGHAPYVDVVCESGRGLREKAIQGLLRKRLAFLEESVMEAGGLVVPGLGFALLFARVARDARRERRRVRELVGSASEVGAAGGELAGEVVDQLCALGRAQFPVVLFVEDVHLADDTLLEAIDGVVRGGSHLLVITTSWPGRIDDNPKLSGLVRELGDRVLRVGHLHPAGPPFGEGAGLTSLEATDCAEIVRAYYPNAQRATVELLVDRYHNPWALELVCQMYWAAFGEGGDLRIDPEEIDVLPYGTEELYEAFWERLPEELKLRYAVAAAISPEAINTEAGRGYRAWSDLVLDEVAAGLKLPTRADLAEAVGEERDAYGWVVHVDEYLRRWAESDQQHVAAGSGTKVLTKRLRTSARRRILEELAKVMLREGTPNVHHARTILALHAEGFITDPAPVATATAAVLNHLGDDDTHVVERLRLYDIYLDQSERDPNNIDAHTDIQTRLNGINAMGSQFGLEQVVHDYQQLCTRAHNSLGPHHPLTLDSQRGLAWALRRAGRVDESIAMFERVVADTGRILGEDHPNTPQAQRELAWALRRAGRVDESIAMFERVVADTSRVLGEDHPNTQRARVWLADALRREGRVDEALTQFERVVADTSRALGEDHPNTQQARVGLAKTLRRAGRVDESIAMIERVVADTSRTLGEDHPDIQRARMDLAETLRQAGHDDESIAMFERVVADTSRTLGEDHPDTRQARRELAEALEWARGPGRSDELIATRERVVADTSRTLGEDHPDTRQARRELAEALEWARGPGRSDELIATRERVVADTSRVLGEDHPDIQRARMDLAWALRRVGRVDESIAMWERVLADTSRALGEDHPDTLWTLLQVGRADEASARWKRVLADTSRVLGEDHPKTRRERAWLAWALLLAGRVDEALTQFERVVADTSRVLGEDHSDTLDARRELAKALQRAGRVDESIAMWERVVADTSRVLGEDHPDTRQAQGDLAEALRKAGRA